MKCIDSVLLYIFVFYLDNILHVTVSIVQLRSVSCFNKRIYSFFFRYVMFFVSCSKRLNALGIVYHSY